MRNSGVLLPVSALPSKYGIGTFGSGAFEFIDFLSASCQHYWQVLPLGHTGYADSPYQCFSAFAGNPYFIDPELLYMNGLIKSEDLPIEEKSENINYGKLFKTRINLIKSAAEKVDIDSEEYNLFCQKNQKWLDDYSLFMAVKEKYKMNPLKEWDDDIRCPDTRTLEKLKYDNMNESRIWKSIQFLFFSQWERLKEYAAEKKVEIIGDVPIYVSADSCDMWLYSDMFITDSDNMPSIVSGCPPDRYSPLGQLWGNPLYNWENHIKNGYSWWIERMKKSCEMFDVVRIDHFRGFEDYYGVDVKASTAVVGKWYKGPSKDFIKALKKDIPNIRIIAEDLGNITDDVRELLDYSGFPGMKILQFAFDDVCDNEFLPHRYPRACVAYTGTHDNPTMRQWAVLADDISFSFAKKYLNVNNTENFVNDCIRTLFASVADTVIIPIQDWLDLGSEGRMNVPSIADGNWKWRVPKGSLNSDLSERIAEMTKLYFRNAEEN